MIRNLLQIIACYLVGLVAGNIVFFPVVGPLAIAFVFGGAVVAAPILILTMFIFAIGRNAILRNLGIWCAIAPFLLLVIWFSIEWSTNYSNRGHDIYWYLSLRNVWERGTLAFICSSISSALFWRWNRGLIASSVNLGSEKPTFE
jgi:hypothetical protein